MPVCKFRDRVSVRVEVTRETHAMLKAMAQDKRMHLGDFIIELLEEATFGKSSLATR